MVSIEVKDFGPIIEGKIDLKPLTIFVGPNSSGKSYMAMLIYALCRAIPSVANHVRYTIPYEQTREILSELAQWTERHRAQVASSSSIPPSKLPVSIREYFEWANQEWGDGYADALQDELSHCFGANVSELVHKGSVNGEFEIKVNQSKPQWNLWMVSDNDEIVTKENSKVAIKSKFKQNDSEMVIGFPLGISPTSETFYSLFHNFPEFSYYLPASRIGIVQTYRLSAGAIVRRLSGKVQIPSVSGVIAHLISELLTIDTKLRSQFLDIAEYLEKELVKGKINMETSLNDQNIYYESDNLRIPLHSASSMISEVTPLALFIKHKADLGDMLLIEEPESNLHPENQRKLARVIVKLIRKGLKVTVTTHSDYFLTQLSNFVRLSRLPEQRAEQGYDEEDYLMPEDVGCYLFDWDEAKGGSKIRSIQVDTENGIGEEEFSEVAESLYNEFVSLERALIE